MENVPFEMIDIPLGKNYPSMYPESKKPMAQAIGFELNKLNLVLKQSLNIQLFFYMM